MQQLQPNKFNCIRRDCLKIFVAICQHKVTLCWYPGHYDAIRNEKDHLTWMNSCLELKFARITNWSKKSGSKIGIVCQILPYN